MSPQINAYMVLLEGRKDMAGDGFLPLHWPVRPDGVLREAVLHDHLYATIEMQPDQLYGLFSSKFTQKTGLEFSDIERIVHAHPDRDLYLFNPFPQARYYTFNVWEQGEACHPGLIEAANSVLRDLGYAFDVSEIGRQNLRQTCYCNYWIAKRCFWEAFMRFVGPLYEQASRNIGEGAAFAVARYHEPAVFFPFIYERMLSTFLSLEPGIRAVSHDPGRERIKRNCVAPVDRLIVDLVGAAIDRWDENGRIDTRHRRLFRAAHRTQQVLEKSLRVFG